MRIRRSAHGFTMIEMIMLIAIGAFVVGGIVAFTRNVTENTIALKDRLAALDLAQRQMETELNAYYGWIGADPGGDCLDSTPEFKTHNLKPGITETVYGSFKVQRNVTETITLTPRGDDFSQPLGPDVAYNLCVGLKKIDILVDYTGGDFTSPLISLTAYKESHVFDDTD